MSCLGPCYVPNPPRAWNRVQSQCSYAPTNTDANSQVFVPLLDKYVNQGEAILFAQLLAKGNVLQYKKNSSTLSKAQTYSKLVRRESANRTTWATQSDTYTNPNTQSLKRVGNINITLNGIQTNADITCPVPPTPQPPIIIPNVVPNTGDIPNPIIPPPPPDPPQPGDNTTIPIVPVDEPIPDIVIADGGILICNIQEDPCTKQTSVNPGRSRFNPTSDSDVPGPIRQLYWDSRLQTWYPRQRLTMNNSTDKWPVNATLLPAYGTCPT